MVVSSVDVSTEAGMRVGGCSDPSPFQDGEPRELKIPWKGDDAISCNRIEFGCSSAKRKDGGRDKM
jgi:hypothetical protein